MFENEDRSLDVAAWHLQMLLTSVGSFDGKIMFLTALNVAGMSALIGIVIAADPSIALLAVGFVLLSIGTALGLGMLWSTSLQQFPRPDEIIEIARDGGGEPAEILGGHFAAIHGATEQASNALRARIRVMRILITMTLVALAIVVATALTAVI